MTFDPKVPPSLLALQKWFAKMEVRPFRRTGEFHLPVYDRKTAAAIEKRISSGPKLSAVQRMGIYNQQYWWRFFTLMQERYLGLVRLFGHTDFNRSLVEPYLQEYDPDHWSLNTLGSRLPLWIEENYCEEDRSLVLGMALVDEACERLLYVPELSPLKAGEEKGKIFLQPFVILLELDADIIAFRKQLIEHEVKYWEEASDFPPIEWADKKRWFALFRIGEEVQSEEISEEEFALLKAFERGATLGEACAPLKEASQIREWFQKWAVRSWFTAEASPSGPETGMSQPGIEAFS